MRTIYATETADNLRAVIACLWNQFPRKDWEAHVQCRTPNAWLTDCQSLHEYLVNPTAAGCEGKRLEVYLEGLRESLWEYADGSCKEIITEQQHDKPRWIDTSAIICDPLTKSGPEQFASRLISTMESGLLDLAGTVSSQRR